jgi:hypothetical protein
MIKVILAFKKFQYELSGDTNQEFSIETKSELESDPSFLRMYDLIDFFEYKTPFFTELFAWIYPSNKMTKLFGVKKSKYNHLCWSQYERMKSNLVFKFNETTFTTPKILDEWIKYLPAESYKIALKMFRQAASNTTLIYETDEECLKVIEGEISDKIENADRELILNELCSVNNIPLSSHLRRLFRFIFKN